MIIAGLDEAGRGPALGPMVIGLAVAEKKEIQNIQKLGLKDSKLLLPRKRETLYTQLQKTIKKKTIHIDANELDSLMQQKSLNEIEAMKIAELLNSLKTKPDIVYIDCPDTLPDSFKNRLNKYLKFKPHLVIEHKADNTYPIVSAASVFAKVERDRAIQNLAQEYGNMGSGYSSDEKTINFIKKYIKENKSLPPFARKQWATNKRLMQESQQTKLF